MTPRGRVVNVLAWLIAQVVIGVVGSVVLLVVAMPLAVCDHVRARLRGRR